MSTDATELMRMMVIRGPEPKVEQPSILLIPSDDIKRAQPPLQRARELLMKKLAETNRRIVDPSKVPNERRLAKLRQLALRDESEGADPAGLVEDVFSKSAAAVIEPAQWEATLRKLSDNLLFYKLAYSSGPRPLAELADLYRAMVSIERIAASEIGDMKTFRSALDAPLQLPRPFRRTEVDSESDPIEARRQRAVETALGRVRAAIELHEAEQDIHKAIEELSEVPIDSKNFATLDLAVAGGDAKRQAGPSGSGDDSLAVNWAVRREALKEHAGAFAPRSDTKGLALTTAAVRGLSAETKKIVAATGLDPAAEPVERVASALVAKHAAVRTEREASLASSSEQCVRTIGGVSVSRSVRAEAGPTSPPIPLPDDLKLPPDLKIDWDDLLVEGGWPGATPEPDPEPDLGPSQILPAGVGQLFVIRQQITGYRSGEISHVENVLPGETRKRQHRRLKQQEITSTEEHEREQEDEKSLQTTNRAELEREVQATIKRQFNSGASAEVSGDYGRVEFTASGQVQASTASEAASKTAQRVASEVIETSRQRVTERLRSERTQKTLEELEETNLHRFSGEELTEPFVGVYQWIDKVYRNEIWSYGKRTMYEVVVPEPGSALIAAAMTPGAPEPTLVEKPPPLTTPIALLDPPNVHRLCVTYGVTEEIEPYPEPMLINVAFTQASDANASDNFYAETKDVEVPDGYEPVDGWIAVRARGEDHTPMIGVTIGAADLGAHVDNLVEDSVTTAFSCSNWAANGRGNIEKLQAAVALDDYSSFAVSILIRLRPSVARIDKWRRDAYAAIRSAYDARMGEWRDYQAQVNFEKPELSEKLLDSNPSANRLVVRQELQRGAMEIFRNASMDFDLIREGSSVHAIPRIDLPGLAEASPEILFLSQAFEWHNMTFVIYPYFFGRRPEWPLKMLLANGDLNFIEFLKSGAARVQVPVRPGFEAAVDHYMMTREPFFGQGMPQIGDDLYLPYVDEARDVAGAALGGEHHKDLDFEVTVPTTLVVARDGKKIDVEGGTLPRWVKTGGTWEEA